MNIFDNNIFYEQFTQYYIFYNNIFYKYFINILDNYIFL
jgi:hypothetical protein